MQNCKRKLHTEELIHIKWRRIITFVKAGNCHRYHWNQAPLQAEHLEAQESVAAAHSGPEWLVCNTTLDFSHQAEKQWMTTVFESLSDLTLPVYSPLIIWWPEALSFDTHYSTEILSSLYTVVTGHQTGWLLLISHVLDLNHRHS